MVESKDNVKVAIRVRPLNEKEISEGGKKCLKVSENFQTILISDQKSFTYDYVADEDTSQDKLFEMVGRPIASSSMSGYNGTIFAYGQTGSGKTFTIQGSGAEDISPDSSLYMLRGVLPRCFEYIFASIASAVKSSKIEFLVKCSYLEIYQEQINDLLDPSPHNLQLREDMKKGVYVDGLIEQPCRNLLQTYGLLKSGARNRHVSSTTMNKESSRSHSVFTLNIESRSDFEGLTNFKSSRFNLIDLAGSERQKATACLGERLKEAGMINKSLSALGNVINSLVEVSEGRPRHIPYRDSKLTFLLRDSLGGNARTFIIANVSPALSAFSETLSTLKFAQRAKLIRNSAVINEDTSGTVLILKAEIRRLKEELENVRQIAELAVNKCPKCAGAEMDLPRLVSTFEKNLEVETLLESNFKLRIEGEKEWQKVVNDKEKTIQNLRILVSELESRAAHDKMILKFRDSTIEKISQGDTEAGIQEIMNEVQVLREQLETNPLVSKLAAENKLLNDENNELRAELESAFASTRQENTRLKEFTEKLNEGLKNSCLEREKVKSIFKELLTGKDIDLIFQGLEEKYENQLQHLKTKIEEQNEKIRGFQKRPDPDLSEFKTKDLETCFRHEKDLEELKLKLVNETQVKEKLYFEKISFEKQVSDLTLKVAELLTCTEKCCVLESQLEISRLQFDEKDRELLLASQEIDNLTESAEYLKNEMNVLAGQIASETEKNTHLELKLALLEKLSKDQAEIIKSLQDPTGNKTLALALAERDDCKKRVLELQQDLNLLKKSYSDLSTSHSLLTRTQEATQLDLKSASFTLGQLKEKLMEKEKSLAESQENEQSLDEEVQRLKEIIEREKLHSDISKERMMKKHNEAIQKLALEKTELVKELDILKSLNFKLGFEISEGKNKENATAERLAKEIKKNERINDEVIEAKVLLEKTTKDFKVEKEKIETFARETQEKNEKLHQKLEETLKESQKLLEKTQEFDSLLLKNNLLESSIESLKNQLEVEKSESQKANFLKKEVENLKEKTEEMLKISETDKKNLKLALQKTEKEKRELLERIENLSKDKEKLSEEVQQISCEKENLLIEDQLLRLEKETLGSEVKHLTSDKEKLMKSLENLNAELLDLRKKLEESKKNASRLETEKKIFSEQASIQKANAEDLERKLRSLEDLLDSLEKSKEFVVGEKEQLQTIYFQSIESVKKIEDSLKQANGELEKEKNKNKALTIDYQCVKVAQEELLKKLNNHLAKYSELEDKWKKDSSKLAESEAKSAMLTEKNQEYQEKIQESEEIIEDLRNKVKSFSGQQKFFQDNLELLKEKNMKNLKDQVEAAQGQVFEYEERLKALESEKDAKIKDLEEKHSEHVKRLIAELKVFEKKLADSRKETQAVELELRKSQEMNENCSDVQKELQNLKTELKNSLHKNRELFQVIEEKNKKNKEQEILCINLLNEQEQCKIQSDLLVTQVEELKKTLKNMTAACEEGKIMSFKLNNENKDLKFALERLNKEKNQIFSQLELKNLLVEELEKEKDLEKEKIQSLEKSFLEVSEEYLIEKQKIAPIEEEISELKQKHQKSLENLEKTREENKKNVQDLLDKLRKLEEKSSGQSKIIQNYSESLKALENSLKASEDCKNSLNSQLEHQKVQENVQILEISSLKSQICLLSDQQTQQLAELSKARQELLETNQKIRESSQVQSKLQQTVENLTKESTELLTSINLGRTELAFAHDELERSRAEVAKLKEELKAKNDFLKAGGTAMGQDDLKSWQRQVEEKNSTIQQLRQELDLLKMDMQQNNNDKYHEKQCEYLTKLLKVKEKELSDLKSKGFSELETSFDLKKKEAELERKKHEAAQTELNQVKGDLLQSLDARDELMTELKTVRDNESRLKRDCNEAKAMNSQLKDDNLRMLKEITKINEDFLKITEKNYWEVEPADRQNWKIKKLEESILGLENQVRAKTGELEKCNRILTEMKKKSNDEGNLKKEIEKQAEEINGLNEGLSRISQFVFSLISPDPEDTCVIESTLKAIKKIHGDAQNRENKGKMLRRQDSGNIKVNIPMSSASEKSLRVQSPSLRQKKFK